MSPAKLLQPFVVFMVILMLSCHKSDFISAENSMNPSSGLGDSTGSPSGVPYNLPAGVAYTDQIKSIKSPLCTTDTMRFFGCCQFVRLAVHLRNNNNAPITVTFPQGLVFKSNDLHFQNGALLQTFNTTIPANTDWCVNLYLFCLNENRLQPSDAAIFSNPVITINPGLKELIQLLSAKELFRITDHGHQYSDALQKAVWHITDGTGLTPADYAYVNTLPIR